MHSYADITTPDVSRSSRILIQSYFLWGPHIYFFPTKDYRSVSVISNIKVISAEWIKKMHVHNGPNKYWNLEDAYLNFIKSMEILVFAKLNCKSGERPILQDFEHIMLLVGLKIQHAWLFPAFSAFSRSAWKKKMKRTRSAETLKNQKWSLKTFINEVDLWFFFLVLPDSSLIFILRKIVNQITCSDSYILLSAPLRPSIL